MRGCDMEVGGTEKLEDTIVVRGANLEAEDKL